MVNKKQDQPAENDFPQTLQEAIVYFADKTNALNFMIALRWPNGITCPRCNSDKYTFISTRQTWQCKACKKMFTVKLGTVLEDSPIGLDKWLTAMWLIVNAKNGISSYEIHRAIGITQKSAWFLLHRLRMAMQTGTFEKLSGQVEADETFVGGKAKNMHASKREAKIQGRGPVGKAIVMGLLERHGNVKAQTVSDRQRETLQAVVKEHVEPGAELFTDALESYTGLDAEYVHQVINHAEKYVEGQVHTNSIENFWSLFKRCIGGTYVSVEADHLTRYLDEETFRFNARKEKDTGRFLEVASGIKGRRLTYKQLIDRGDDLLPRRGRLPKLVKKQV